MARACINCAELIARNAKQRGRELWCDNCREFVGTVAPGVAVTPTLEVDELAPVSVPVALPDDPRDALTVVLSVLGGIFLIVALAIVVFAVVLEAPQLALPAVIAGGAGLQTLMLSDIRHSRQYLGAIYRLQRARR